MAGSNPMVATPTTPKGMSQEEAMYRGVALSQLNILRQHMQLGGLNSGRRSVRLDNGVEIHCNICFNKEDVFVSVPPKAVVGQDTVEYAYNIIHRVIGSNAIVTGYTKIVTSYYGVGIIITSVEYPQDGMLATLSKVTLYANWHPVQYLKYSKSDKPYNDFLSYSYRNFSEIRSNASTVEMYPYFEVVNRYIPNTAYYVMCSQVTTASVFSFKNKLYNVLVPWCSYSRVVVFDNEAFIVLFSIGSWHVYDDGSEGWLFHPNSPVPGVYAEDCKMLVTYIPVADVKPVTSLDSFDADAFNALLIARENVLTTAIDIPYNMRLHFKSDNKTAYGVHYHNDYASYFPQSPPPDAAEYNDIYTITLYKGVGSTISCAVGVEEVRVVKSEYLASEIEYIFWCINSNKSYSYSFDFDSERIIAVDVVKDALVKVYQIGKNRMVGRRDVNDHGLVTFTSSYNSSSVKNIIGESEYLVYSNYFNRSLSTNLDSDDNVTGYNLSGASDTVKTRCGFFDMRSEHMYHYVETQHSSTAYSMAMSSVYDETVHPLTVVKDIKDHNNGTQLRSRTYTFNTGSIPTDSTVTSNSWDLGTLDASSTTGSFGYVAEYPLFIGNGYAAQSGNSYLPAPFITSNFIVSDSGTAAEKYICLSILFDSDTGDFINYFSDNVPWKDDASAVREFNLGCTLGYPESSSFALVKA